MRTQKSRIVYRPTKLFLGAADIGNQKRFAAEMAQEPMNLFRNTGNRRTYDGQGRSVRQRNSFDFREGGIDDSPVQSDFQGFRRTTDSRHGFDDAVFFRRQTDRTAEQADTDDDELHKRGQGAGCRGQECFRLRLHPAPCDLYPFITVIGDPFGRVWLQYNVR